MTKFLLLAQLALGNLAISKQVQDLTRRETDQLVAVDTAGSLGALGALPDSLGSLVSMDSHPAHYPNSDKKWCFLQDGVPGRDDDGPLAQMAVQVPNCEICNPLELVRMSGGKGIDEFSGYHMSRYLSFSAVRESTTKVHCKLGSNESGYAIEDYGFLSSTDEQAGLKECWLNWIKDTEKFTLGLKEQSSPLSKLERRVGTAAGAEDAGAEDAWKYDCGVDLPIPDWFWLKGEDYYRLTVRGEDQVEGQLSAERTRQKGDVLLKPMVSLYPVKPNGKKWEQQRRHVLDIDTDIKVEYKVITGEDADEMAELKKQMANAATTASDGGDGGETFLEPIPAAVLFMNGAKQKDTAQAEVRGLRMPLLCCKLTESELGEYKSIDGQQMMDGKHLMGEGTHEFIRSQAATVQCKMVTDYKNAASACEGVKWDEQ